MIYIIVFLLVVYVGHLASRIAEIEEREYTILEKISKASKEEIE